ncbi:molybdopterin molybdotransferase MoeA [Candidatus Poribacteria bacterium]|nr:molybdopterin molybdotransferase MoeA [Candidatus Poribacteria bacterium]
MAVLSYEEALGRILSLRLPLGAEAVPLLEACGRYLAGPVTAPWPLPRFDNSSMDGFAVRCADLAEASAETPVSLPVAGESAAGHPPGAPLLPGTAMRISTGARIPEGADGIVPVERTTIAGDAVQFREPAVAGRFIRRRGEDVREGAQLFGRGKRLDPPVLAYLGMYNRTSLEVLKRPRVAIFTSGDEVKPLGGELRETDVVGVNIYYLEHELRAFGCETRLFGIVPDVPRAFRETLEAALEWADLIVTTAGVSVGDHDVVGQAVRELKGEVLLWKSAVRPGKPMLVATVRERPFFGLPGNPLSVCCNTEIYLKPFLRQALGIAPVRTPPEPMRLLGSCPVDKSRLYFVYGRCALVDGAWTVEALAGQSSGNLSVAAHANCLIAIEPSGTERLEGGIVPVMRIRCGE